MYIFHNLPIRKKLTLILLLTCGLLVTLMSIIFITDKYFSFRRNKIASLNTLAQVVGMNSTAALLLDDPATGRKVLSAISADPDVTEACILRQNGETFAYYPLEKKTQTHSDGGVVKKLIAQARDNRRLNSSVHQFSGKRLILVKSVAVDHKPIGYITIFTSLDELYDQIQVSAAIVVGLMIALFLSAQLVTTRLHRSISAPLVALLSTMEQVKADENYTLRAKKQGNDELGVLVDGFNGMLARIEQRDQQLEQHRLKLEEQVARRTHELIRSNEKLIQEMEERKQMQDELTRAQRMEAVGTLAAGVAHDLNNILSGIVSYPDLLLLQLPEESDMRKPLFTIQNSGQKAAAIVQDLLTLARRGVTTSEVVNIGSIIDDYLNSPEHVELMAHHPRVRVTQHYPDNLMNISGSPVHLEKTIMNIVSNAAEAITGVGVIAISLQNKYIDTPVRGYDEVQQGDYVLLEISDTGHGIANTDLKRIFEPFYTKKKMGRSGTGLGMAVVWGTVKDHRGYIDVESHKDHGTKFRLYFPVTRKQHDCLEPVHLKDFMGKGQSILVVDDVEEQRKIASDILQSLDYQVTTVESGEAAIEHLQHHHVDLMLLDMIMDTGIDGMETYERIVSKGKKQRAIIASGYSESKRVKKAQELGAGAYLRKPYTIENLALAVHKELQ